MALLRSKLRPPVLSPAAVPRPRLLQRVVDPRWRIVVLQAPAGYGKSTLAGQVAAASPRTSAWLHLDQDEANPRRFCRYLTAAIAEVLPAIGSTELARLIERRAFEPERWAEDLLLFFDEMARTGCRLILDNAETIGDAPAPLACLRRLIDPGSERLRLLIASRRAPGIPLQRLVAQGRALVLTETDLAFDLEEYRRAAGAHGTNAPAHDVEAAWERSRGWCVLLGLGAASAGGNAEAAGEAYFEEEVLGRLPQALREFLVRSSVLDVVTAEGLAAIGLDPAAFGERLELLAAHGVPHLAVEEGSGVRMHPLIRARCLGELRTRAGEADRLAARAAEHFRRQGRYEAAVQLLADLGLDERALRMLHEDWDALEHLDLQPRIEDWLKRLGPEAERHPLYVVVLARHLRFVGDNRRLADLLARTRPVWSGDVTLAPPMWALETWAATHRAEGPDYAVRAAEWARLRPHAAPADVVLAEFSLANAAVYALQLEAGMAHVQAVLAALPPGEGPRHAGARNAVAVILQELGRSREALAVHEENIEACARADETGYLTLNMVGKAYVLKELGRYADALATVDACLEAARRGGAARLVLQANLARTRGECWWHLGRRRAGLAELERAFRDMQDYNRFEALGTGVLIDHWTLVSEGEPAGRVSAADFADHPVCEPHVRFLIHRGRAEAMRGRTDEACSGLAAARELAHDMPAWQATAWLTEAWALRAVDRGASRAALREGLARLAAIGAASYPMADPVLTAWAVTEALAAGVEPAQAAALVRGGIATELAEAIRDALGQSDRPAEEVARLVQAATGWRLRGLTEAMRGLQRIPEAQCAAYLEAIESAPLAPLRVRMLGPLEVEASERSVRFTRKASRAVFESLLIDWPRPVHEEKLLAAIWPEAAPRKAARSLQTAVNELRKSLDPFHGEGHRSYVTFEDEHYVLHLPSGSEVDLHRFREAVGDGLGRAAGTERGAGRMEALRRGLALWRGELLADAPYAEHAMEARERMRALFLEGTLTLARSLEEDDPRAAIRLLERGLDADPYWSEGVGVLLACLAREGRTLAALRRYRDYEARLERELGVPPDEQLRSAVEPILGRGSTARPR